MGRKNVQFIFKKSLTGPSLFAIVNAHTVNTNYKNMRTKALLSVAAIAASAISAMAQGNVYSLNIVGYATVTVPAGFSILANPLSAGATNGANEIGLTIDSEQILTWNPANSSFNYVSFDSTLGGWIDAQLNPSTPPSLPPGKGFFFFNPATTATNITFVGQVVPGPGAANSNSLPLIPGFSMIGSPLPANVTNISSAPVSLPLIDSMQVLTWNNATSKYAYSSFDSTLGGWIDANLSPITAPGYSIGQGFFFFNPGNQVAHWNQSLP